MLKKRELYKATQGVENEGYQFEVAMLCFYCFHFCYNEEVNDFKIAIYDDLYHPFDDIVIDITTNDTEKYAIQLKHVKDKLPLNSNHFGKNGKMVLSKYFKFNFSKTNHVLLLTNGTIGDEIAVPGFHMRVKNSVNPIEKSLDTCDNEENHIYEFCCNGTSKKITFYTSQKCRNSIDEEIKKKFKEKFHIDDDSVGLVVHKFKSFLQEWKKGFYENCKLDREDIKLKISEILFFEHIITYQPKFETEVDGKRALLQKVLNSYNVSIVEDMDEETINGLCCFNLEKNSVIEDGRNCLINANENDLKDLALILWRLCKFPLIVRVEDGNKKMIQEVLKDLQGENLSFILVGNISKKDFEIHSVFENLTDLESSIYYPPVTSQFKLSIQGQDEISLKELNNLNPRFSEITTMKELIQISNGNFVVGDVEGPLPQPYIPRRLFTTILKINSLEHVPNELFVISGNHKIIKEKFPKGKFWSLNDLLKRISLNKRLPPHSIVLCEENSKCFSICLKYTYSNVHCLRVVDDEHLQLLCSKTQSENLREFQIHSEDQLHRIVKNNINLICGGPGMGKLTMLRFLRKTAPSGFWTRKVNMREIENCRDLYTWSGTKYDLKVKQCLKEVRRHMYFVCGLDNLPKDMLHEVMEAIAKMGEENFKIWIFCETQMKDTLEKSLGVKAMCIEELNKEEQRKYISERFKDSHMTQAFERILPTFRYKTAIDILGVPLNLYMLTEIFINDPKANIEEVLVLTDICRYFIQTKYKRYLEKVSSDGKNQIIEDGMYYRNEQYKLAAISCLKSPYFKKLAGDCDPAFIEQIQRIGDVIGIIFKVTQDGTIIFTQQTFADYFAALWVAKNVDKVDMRSVMHQEGYINIMFMYSLELCKNNPAHKAILSQNFELLLHFKDRVTELDPTTRSAYHLAFACGTIFPKLKKQNGKILGDKETFREDLSKRRILDYLTSNVPFDPLQAGGKHGWDFYDFAFYSRNIYAIDKILSIHPNTEVTVLEKLEQFKDLVLSIVYFSVKCAYKHLLKVVSKTRFFLEALTMENCKGENLLHLAVKTGDCDVVNILLDSGAKINAVTSIYNRRSSLHFAAENGHKDVLQLLLKRGASVDIPDRYRNTPLHLASCKGDLESVKFLVENSCDVNSVDNFGRTSLQLAAMHGHIEIVKYLIDRGVVVSLDKFGNSPLSCASNKEIIELLSNEETNSCIVFSRTLPGNKCEEYISHQLHWVASIGQTDRIKPLLEEGWNINEADHFGRTPLHRAVTQNHLKTVEILCENGADVNIPDQDKIVPLCRAISDQNFDMVKLLLTTSLDVRDDFNYTPLHWAAMVGNLEIVKLLMSKHPDIEALDSFGRKPIDCAVENGFYDVVALLDNSNSRKVELAKERFKFLEFYSNSKDVSVNRTKVEKKVNDINKAPTTPYSSVAKATEPKLFELNQTDDTDDNNNNSYMSHLLHKAVFHGNFDAVASLTSSNKHNVDINAVDAFGYNCVGIATMTGHSKILELLLKVGGNLDVVDKFGNTPLDWACKKGHIQCVKILLENEAVARTVQGDFLGIARKQNNFQKIVGYC